MASQSTIRVLFIETEKGNGLAVEIFMRQLTAGLVEVATAKTADEIRDKAFEPYDLILLDVDSADGLKGELTEKAKLSYGRLPILDLADGSIEQPVAGAIVSLETHFAPLSVNAVALLRTLNHVLERRRLEQRAEALQSKLVEVDRVDPVTGLWTRAYTMERIAETFHDWQRYHYPMTLCMMDILDLDKINETYGFEISDQVIAAFGKLVREVKRNTDHAGRFGLDRFCVAFPSTPQQSALIGIERIREAVKRTVFTGKRSENFTVGAAYGVVELGERHYQLEDLIRDARNALTRAKSVGAGHIEVVQPDATGGEPV